MIIRYLLTLWINGSDDDKSSDLLNNNAKHWRGYLKLRVLKISEGLSIQKKI